MRIWPPRLVRFVGAVVALLWGSPAACAGGAVYVGQYDVSERIREMATLKVLGFYDREVHNYVNREMMILTGMGVVVGLPLGRWIGGLLTAALNMPSLYFEVEVHWYSYAIAVVRRWRSRCWCSCSPTQCSIA